MSNITITNNIKEKAEVQYIAGQYYRDRTTGDVYILAIHSYPHDHSLICLRGGASYSLDSTKKPIGAFSGDEAVFELIEDIEIILN